MILIRTRSGAIALVELPLATKNKNLLPVLGSCSAGLTRGALAGPILNRADYHVVGGDVAEHLLEQVGGVNAKWCVCVLGGAAAVVFDKFSRGAHGFSEPRIVS